MNLVDELLKADVKKATELATGTFESAKLASLLGKEKVEIKIREIKARKLNEIISYQIDRKGNPDFEKIYDGNILMCVNGIVEPNLQDTTLQEHFGAKNARHLTEILFGSEVNAIAEAITKLSEITTENVDEEVKN